MKLDNVNRPISDLYSTLSEFISKADIYAANMLSTIAFSIHEKRVEMGMTQAEFGDMMGVTQGMVSKWEKGDYNFTIGAIADICEKLKMSVDIVIEDEGSKTRKTYKTNSGFLYEIASAWMNNSDPELRPQSGIYEKVGAAS